VYASILQTQRYLNVTDEELRRGLEVSREAGNLVAGACNQRYLQLWSGAA